MKRTLLVGAIVALLLSGGGVAFAQTPAPLSCGAALTALTAAQTRGLGTQAEVDRLTAAQTELGKTLAAAQKALTDAGPPPAPVTPVYQALINAVTAATTALGNNKDALDKAIAADVAADTASLAAQRVADEACRAKTVTTTSTPAPIVIPIPKAIDTGRGL